MPSVTQMPSIGAQICVEFGDKDSRNPASACESSPGERILQKFEVK